MARVLVATGSGIRTFTGTSEGPVELPGRQVFALAPAEGGGCFAVVGGTEIWKRGPDAEWSLLATSELVLTSIGSVRGQTLGGAMSEAAMVRVGANQTAERVSSFDAVPGHEEWYAGGPPLHLRAITATADGSAILAAVHVGGIPRSTDGGKTWEPTIPVNHDVHEVQAHRTLPIVAAACALGLCVSRDNGKTWNLLAEDLELTDSLAVAVLADDVLFSIQDGPFADCAQIWRWRIGGDRIEQVREGLPQWLGGKVDTAHLAAGDGRAAILDGGGSLWLSREGSTGWERIASELPYAFGVLVL